MAGARYRPEGLDGPAVDGRVLCKGVDGSKLCPGCKRYKPGRLTPQHSVAPLGTARACSYRRG
jgi:hypothetical protein